MLKGKNILLGVTGSIAAYKAAVLTRLLIRDGARVQVVMTPSAADFITPLTLSTLSGNPVQTETFHTLTGKWNSHVEWANWADLILIAPLTANTMAKMAAGQVDNLLLAIYLAARCPVYFAPAMDVDMLEHPATKKNIEALQSFGNIMIPPGEGFLASGMTGKGRMKEPEDILAFLQDAVKKKSKLSGKKVLVTAGPTHEKIDAVRYIGNYSTGKMGYAIANEFDRQGAIVKLVSGPVSLVGSSPDIEIINVSSAEEMQKVCLREFPGSDITVMAAAVADYKPSHPAINKTKKSNESVQMELVPTADILSNLGKLKKKGQILAGFALETDHAHDNAKSKLKNKNLDLIVLNSLKDEGAGFGYDTNKVTIISKTGQSFAFGLKGKDEVAVDIVKIISDMLSDPH